MRSTSQLPDSDELKKIMEAEAKRDVPPEKMRVHYPDFSPFLALLDHLGIEAEFMRRDMAEEEWFSGDCQAKGDALIVALVGKCLAASVSELRPYYDAIYAYLSEEDALKSADVMFVFGAKTPLRAEKAIALYQQGLAPTIVFSGHGSYTGRTEKTEAEAYQELALAAGIPTEAIIVESASITVPDNVRTTLNLFDATGIHPKRILTVNSPYVQRRGWCLFKKYLPDTVELIRQNSATAEKYSRGAWFTNEDGLKVVLNEFVKMKIAVVLNTA